MMADKSSLRILLLLSMNLRLCISEIGSNKRRTIITSFGIFLGMASLLILLSFMRGMQKMVDDELTRMGGLNVVTIRALEPQDPEESVLFQRSPGLRLEQLEEAKGKIANISRILAKHDTNLVVSSMGKEARAGVAAVTPDHFPVFNYVVGMGRSIVEEDMNRTASVCVVGQRVAERLFGNMNPIGSTLSFRNRSFKVVGVLKTENMWDWRSRTVLYPYSVYARNFSSSNSVFQEIAVSVSDVTRLHETAEALRIELLTLHRGVEDFDIALNETKIKEKESTSFALNVLLVVLASLSLLIGGIGITNIMFATIGDRVREIGLRKALGARKSDLIVQFLMEAVIVTSVGAMPGILVGSIPSLFLSAYLPIEPTLSNTDYSLALSFTIITGIIAGIFPALKAASMNPVEALTHA